MGLQIESDRFLCYNLGASAPYSKEKKMKLRLLEVATWICIIIMGYVLLVNAPYKTKFAVAAIAGTITIAYEYGLHRLRREN